MISVLHFSEFSPFVGRNDKASLWAVSGNFSSLSRQVDL